MISRLKEAHANVFLLNDFLDAFAESYKHTITMDQNVRLYF